MALPSSPTSLLISPRATHLLVRWVHVLSMAALFGGAVLVWGMLRREAAGEEPTAALHLATAYERVFWVGVGLLVLTGVGNLGALAPAIPGPGTRWGVTFSTKLLGVFVLLLGSVVRTLGVAGLRRASSPRHQPNVRSRLRAGYVATAILLLAVVALAEVLAHG